MAAWFRRLRPWIMLAGALGATGLAGAVVFLLTQDLENAEKWASLVGVFVSVLIGLAGLDVGWLAWRRPGA